MMIGGKKSLAQRVVYSAFDKIAEKNPAGNPLEILQRAVDNAKPRLEVKARRVGGATYQVPMEVSSFRRQSLAIRWILASARKRDGKSLIDKLTGEILDAAEGRGGAIKKREDTHKMADANRAFAHYRW